MSIYCETLQLRSRDVDLHRRLRTSRLFELFQEASIRHTEQLGMGREKTLDKGLLWIVTLQEAIIARMPVYDETVTLESWPGETMHVFSRAITVCWTRRANAWSRAARCGCCSRARAAKWSSPTVTVLSSRA
jgi:acyl-ACP thioesterase